MFTSLLHGLSVIPVWAWLLLPLVIVAVFVYLMRSDQGGALWLPKENVYVDPTKGNEKINFPSISAPPVVDVSLVVPAYNEEERLPIMLDAALKYLRKRKQAEASFTYEILIVDDGSRDKTSEIALQYSKTEGINNIRLLKLLKNRGKGGAVKRGILCARGRYMLMVDADGATEISDLRELEENIHKIERDGLGVAVGSRAHLVDSEAVAKRSFFRNILMWGFHVLVSLLGVRGIRDTQCGFKLFTRNAAHTLFSNLHIERWAFDVELLYRAQILRIPTAEVKVNWREIPGSKLSPLASSVQMAKDLLRIRCAYTLGVWRVAKAKAE